MATEARLLTQMVKQKARELGFFDASVAACGVLGPELARYEQWLARGFHAGLAWMERNGDKRGDPSLILPGCRSVVMVGMNYARPERHGAEQGKISRYAWGTDYHEVIPPRLRQLAELIAQHVPGAESKVYADTGPILEKQWAVRSGLGWQGKHSNVISRRHGSWFFLGTLLTTAELVPDTAVPDMCGTCTACIDACPTGAIAEPYTVDTGRCIAYWTIEVKPDREIPDEIAENLDGWLFGCDVCQEVCPWNRFSHPDAEDVYAPRGGITTLSASEVESMPQEEFSERYRKSPVKRTKLAGLRRNARALSKAQNTIKEKR